MIYKLPTSFDLTAGVNSPAMSDHLVRVENLKRIQKANHWSDSELGRQCGRQPQQVRAWWDYPAKATGRQIGEKLARALEEALKLPRYSLDERPQTAPTLLAREGIGQYGAAVKTEQSSTAHEGTQVPVLLWDQLNDMLLLKASDLHASVATLATLNPVSVAAKFVAMPDDSMEPVFSQGDHILFEPAEAPHAGDTVLVRIGSGEHFVRTFRPRTANQWDAAPLNEYYEALSSPRDDVVVVAVMVEHRRYRRRRS